MMNSVHYPNKGSFVINGNKMVISPISIDSSSRPAKDLDLIIDTGAFITLINRTTAEVNGYKIIEEKSCHISGFSEKGLLCDLRIIPTMIFCGFEIKDVIIATPADGGVKVSEVLGMNILENFDFGFNLTKKEIYINKRTNFISDKPRYQSGEVNVSDYCTKSSAL